MRARPAVFALFVVPAILAVAAPAARADEKKVCVDAYLAAQSRRSEQKPLAARAQLRTCARSECAALMRGQMVKDCTSWLAEADASIPTVVFTATDASGAGVQDAQVAVDGTVVAQSLDGRAVEVEPGSHSFTFTTKAGVTATQSAVITEGTKNQAVRVTLGGSAGATPTATPGPATTEASATNPADTTTSSGGWSGRKWLGVGLFGAGAVAAGVGGVLGLMAKSQFNTASGESGQARVNDSASAVSSGNVATIVVVAGGVVAAAGVVVWLTAPSASTQVGTNGRDLVVQGTF